MGNPRARPGAIGVPPSLYIRVLSSEIVWRGRLLKVVGTFMSAIVSTQYGLHPTYFKTYRNSRLFPGGVLVDSITASDLVAPSTNRF